MEDQIMSHFLEDGKTGRIHHEISLIRKKRVWFEKTDHIQCIAN